MKRNLFLADDVLSIGIVGLGLIGGSFAKAIKHYTPHHVYGSDISEETYRNAYEEGAIDGCLTEETLSMCDILFVALYPRQAIAYVLQTLDKLSPGCIVVDLCGVKQSVVQALSAPCKEKGLVFIGGHPMAGREAWGFSHSDAKLFQDASMIVTPDTDTPKEALELLTGLFSDMRFGSITYASPKEHDRMIAFTSQLAHIVSSAYIKSPTAAQQNGFSAGSYKDLTRVAKLNATMWTELFLENPDFLIQEIDDMVKHLLQYRDAIESNDAELLYQLLEDGKTIKEALS